MRYLIFVLVALSFTGCITDKPYSVGKTVYTTGKTVVKDNPTLLDEKTMEELRKIDSYAVPYDKARATIKKSLKTNVDMNSTQENKTN